ncbi:MAG: YccF domain-containing protein [Anaerolineales bacterium]
MSLIGNLLWIFLGGGILVSLCYLVGGIVLCATIVGIPFGVQCFKLAWLALVPFGKEVDSSGSARGLLAIVMNILWLVCGGLEVAVVHLVFAVLCAITIIGLPFAKQHMKLLRLALVPFGATIR